MQDRNGFHQREPADGEKSRVRCPPEASVPTETSLEPCLALFLGAVSNWCPGLSCLQRGDRFWFQISDSALERATWWLNFYGEWKLLMS